MAVVIDCADRMILSWRFSRRILAEDLCEMAREALFLRFGEDTARARGIEFLSDNGPEYIAKAFRAFLERLGLVACHTPVRSPQSNGVAEAFFGSFKRDYVYQNPLPTLELIRQALPGWLADYHERAPHSALKMLSPAQFYRQWAAKVS